jgi:peptidoglycan/LPS O-acetylase OafA/YrhL
MTPPRETAKVPATVASTGVAVRDSGFRPELQVLRAAAVALVVVYHVWPGRLPGGFVGVDVFFVVSGFLITSHLVSGFDRDGRISLPGFWARRARRLLPASLLVLAVTAAGTLVLLPTVQWQQTFREIVASALYVQNWALAADSVDYLAAENVPSPAQHFWSLSVEEQFYVVVPLLLVLAAFLAGRGASAGRRRGFLAATLALVAVASLVASIVLTATDPGPAYFVTPTRAWEFAAGGLLAFAVTWCARQSPALRGVAAWAGWALLVLSGFVITGATPFPGIAAALPVTGALLVIAAGRAPVPWAPDRLLVRRPIVFVGDISYSVYLWHWPVLVFAHARFGLDLPWWSELLLVAVVVVLAWATTRFIENPARTGRFLVARRPRFTMAVAVVAMAVVAVPAGVGWALSRNAATAELEQAAIEVAKGGDCIGAGSRDPSLNCAPTEYPELLPDPSAAVDDKSAAYDEGCISPIGSPLMPICTAGVADGDVRVLAIGDSHAAHWLPAYEAIAEERDWAITTYFKSACALSTTHQVTSPPRNGATCDTWNADVSEQLAGGAPFDLVFVSASALGNSAYPSAASAIAGYREAWATLVARGSEVVVIQDTPRVPETLNACIARNESDPAACDVAVETVYEWPDLMAQAAAGQAGVTVLDFTDYFCWDGTCKAAIGGVVTFRDTHHITATLATTFGPVIGRELDRLGID